MAKDRLADAKLLDARIATEAAKYRDALRDLLLAMHVGKDAVALSRSNACFLLAHPPKYPGPPDRKQPWQRGCPCGRMADL